MGPFVFPKINVMLLYFSYLENKSHTSEPYKGLFYPIKK